MLALIGETRRWELDKLRFRMFSAPHSSCTPVAAAGSA